MGINMSTRTADPREGWDNCIICEFHFSERLFYKMTICICNISSSVF